MLFSRFFPTSLSLCAVLTVVPLLRAADDAKPAERRFPTSEDLRHIKGIGGAQLSPDGKRVLFLSHRLRPPTALIRTFGSSQAAATRTPCASSPSRLPPTSAANARRSGRPTALPSSSSPSATGHTQYSRLDLRGGRSHAPYDLKVHPRGRRVEGEERHPAARRWRRKTRQEGRPIRSPTTRSREEDKKPDETLRHRR